MSDEQSTGIGPCKRGVDAVAELSIKLAEALAARDAAEVEVDKARWERDEARKGRAIAIKERDEARAERDAARTALEAMTWRRDRALGGALNRDDKIQFLESEMGERLRMTEAVVRSQRGVCGPIEEIIEVVDELMESCRVGRSRKDHDEFRAAASALVSVICRHQEGARISMAEVVTAAKRLECVMGGG